MATAALLCLTFALTDGQRYEWNGWIWTLLGAGVLLLRFDALKAGLVMAPAMVLSAVLAPFSGRLSDRLGAKYILMTGLVLFAVGMGWLTLVADVGRTWWDLQAPLVVAGIGIGGVFGPMVSAALGSVEPRLAGAASGVLNTIRQIGTVIGSAAVGALLQNQLAHNDTFVHAMRVTMVLPIVVVAVGAVSCLLIRRRPAEPSGLGPRLQHQPGDRGRARQA